MIERKKLGIIIEARTNSKRFKNKILKKIYKNYSVLDYILKRLKTQKIIKNIVVATTTKKMMLLFARFEKKKNRLF